MVSISWAVCFVHRVYCETVVHFAGRSREQGGRSAEDEAVQDWEQQSISTDSTQSAVTQQADGHVLRRPRYKVRQPREITPIHQQNTDCVKERGREVIKENCFKVKVTVKSKEVALH